MKYQAWVLSVEDDGQVYAENYPSKGAAWTKIIETYKDELREGLEELDVDEVLMRVDAMFDEDEAEIKEALAMVGIDFSIEDDVIDVSGLERVE